MQAIDTTKPDLLRRREDRIAEAQDLLRYLTDYKLNLAGIDLKPIAAFIHDVYVLGCWADPKEYTAKARTYVKVLDKALVQLALDGALIKSNQTSLADDIFALAQVRANVEGHTYRATRIAEEMEMRGRFAEIMGA